MIVVVLIVAGLIALIILAARRSSNRSSNGKFSVAGFLILAFFGIPLLIGILLPSMSPRHTVSVSNEQIMPRSAPAPANTGTNAQRTSPKRTSGETHQNPDIVEAPVVSRRNNNVRGTIPNMLLAGLSMIALLALARVAVDGRRDGGYTLPSRLLATFSFVALCALLWALGPMVN
jgi:hypothetical protein